MGPDEERLEAAIERLAEPGRFAEAETLVARTAPQLQRLLAAALAEGEVGELVAVPDPDARAALIARHLERLEAELDETRAAVTALRAAVARPERPRVSRPQRRDLVPQPAGGRGRGGGGG